jgi:GMP synthase (glutamine-hydrolysing)
MGASVGRSEKGWEISVTSINLNPDVSELFGHRDSLMVHQMHRDAVHSVPKGFSNLGSSPRCEVQGLYLPERVLSLQAHPEFDAFVMGSLLDKRHADGIFDDETYTDGMGRSQVEHDGPVVSETILRFLLERKE